MAEKTLIIAGVPASEIERLNITRFKTHIEIGDEIYYVRGATAASGTVTVNGVEHQVPAHAFIADEGGRWSDQSSFSLLF